MINLEQGEADEAWRSVTQELAQDKGLNFAKLGLTCRGTSFLNPNKDSFDHSVFGIVYEYTSTRLSLVLLADQVIPFLASLTNHLFQSDNRLLKIGAQFKKLLKNVEEVIYEVDERQLLIA